MSSCVILYFKLIVLVNTKSVSKLESSCYRCESIWTLFFVSEPWLLKKVISLVSTMIWYIVCVYCIIRHKTWKHFLWYMFAFQYCWTETHFQYFSKYHVASVLLFCPDVPWSNRLIEVFWNTFWSCSDLISYVLLDFIWVVFIWFRLVWWHNFEELHSLFAIQRVNMT